MVSVEDNIVLRVLVALVGRIDSLNGIVLLGIGRELWSVVALSRALGPKGKSWILFQLKVLTQPL